ncbi:MAG: DUF5721 family protein [Lachnospirales bacterium]
MIVYRVTGEDVKIFMSELYKGNAFNDFPVRFFEVTTFIKYKIDGYLDKNYFESKSDFITWGEILPFALSALKVKNLKPKSVEIEFALDNSIVNINDKVKLFLLHMHYSNDEIILTANTVDKEFTLSKSSQEQWHEFLLNFFIDKKLPVFKDEI